MPDNEIKKPGQEYADWKAPETGKQERLGFDEASEQERIGRTQKLFDLFNQEKSNFQVFAHSVAKQATKFQSENLSITDIQERFARVERAGRLLQDALRFYVEVQKNLSGADNNMDEAGENLDYEAELIAVSDGLADEKNHQLNVGRISDTFRFGIEAYSLYGEQAGFPANMSKEEAAQMAEDLEVILSHVNSYR